MKEASFIFKDQICSGFVVDMPKGITSKVALLEILGRSLRFPDCFGLNWDGFEECIRDLSWLREHDIVVRHADLPLSHDTTEARIYLSIMKDAIEKHAAGFVHNLAIIFPLQEKSVVESLIS